MRVERFWDYYTKEGKNLIHDWYEIQDDPVKVAFDFVLKEILGTKDVTDSKQFKAMRRQHEGLWEIVLEVLHQGRKRQFRPVGFWGHSERDFILVNGCEKSGRFTIPGGVFNSALDIRNRYFEQGEGEIYEHCI